MSRRDEAEAGQPGGLVVCSPLRFEARAMRRGLSRPGTATAGPGPHRLRRGAIP